MTFKRLMIGFRKWLVTKLVFILPVIYGNTEIWNSNLTSLTISHSTSKSIRAIDKCVPYTSRIESRYTKPVSICVIKRHMHLLNTTVSCRNVSGQVWAWLYSTLPAASASLKIGRGSVDKRCCVVTRPCAYVHRRCCVF